MSALVFGEIVEPTTRALIDDELEDYPEYIEKRPEWEGSCETPSDIDTLLFLETEKVKKLLFCCVLGDLKPIGRLKNAGVEIYNVKKNIYIITHFEHGELNTGQIVDAFGKWISTARKTYAITSESINIYQDINLTEKPSSLIRMLSSNQNETIKYNKLQAPNLVTGLGANVLSYCIHIGLKCTLLIAYIDNAPLDSINIGILLELFRKLHIPVIKNVFNEHIEDISSSNLYI
ncbi:hypothetical protein JTB14_005962 [Gonioctena quinquepunctata]|nr:hypothetical protein JTB14_005962 [Gonioctena quinquepunctata]